MKDCITPKEFNRFLEDSLDQESLARFEAHCRTCETCAGELESWKKLKEELHNASCTSIPDGFKEKVMSRVSGERILPAAPVMGIRRGMAFAAVVAVILYSIFRPILRPLLSGLVSGIFRFLSVSLFNLLSAIGLDPGVLIGFFGNIMANLDNLLPFFITSTVLMTAAFILLLIKGRAVRQSG